MIRWDHIIARARGSRVGIPLLLFVLLLLGAASPAQADDCSDFPGGVIDGTVVIPAPSQISINQNCTIQNFTAANPLISNISFFTRPGQNQQRWLVVFDNVLHTGQMSCNSVLEHKIWFTNGSSTSIQQGCQNLLIPVEKIDKQNPAGQTTATIGVPFTYTLTMPVLFDPATGNIINSSGSLNDLHSITLTDDLNATGVDLTYVSHNAYWRDSGLPVAHTFSNVGGVLSFGGFPIVLANDQIILEITVVLEDTPVNTSGTQFVNTAKWFFGRLIDGVFYEPLPGEWGISQPLTIAAPELVVTKSGPTTLGLTLNLGQWGQFGLDIQNTGLSDAWNVTITDVFPDGPTGGMCNTTPQILSAQVFASDGVSTVPGKGPLIAGSDYSFSYSGAPTCELTLTMNTAAGMIGPGERLIITYQTQLDADSQDGATLVNVAGATEWFNGDISNPDRQVYTRTLNTGSVGVPDHEDAHAVTVALSGYFFEKSVENLTSGLSPTTTAAPGDTVRYTLRLQATDVPLGNLTFQDDLGALNASAVFVPGTLTIVPGSLPPGADASNTDPNGGTNGAGLLDIRSLSVPVNSAISIQFDVVVDPTLAEGTIVSNQADLVSVVKLADSDDPNINGQADPDVPNDEDPTRFVIATLPVGPLLKDNTQTTATVGESFSYLVTVPAAPHPFPIYDVRITDDLTASAADLRFVGVSKVSGTLPWTPVNTGSDTNLVIEDTSIGIDIPANEQIVVEITVVLEDTTTNVAGLTFTNTASFTDDTIDDDAASQRPGEPGTTAPMTVIEPDLVVTKGGPTTMTIGTPGAYTLDVQNTGDSTAWNVTLTDQLPDTGSGGTCDTAPTVVSARVYESDGSTPVSPVLVENTDFNTSFAPAPTCQFALAMLSADAAIGVGQRLIVVYDVNLDADTQDTTSLTNVAGATEWFSSDGLDPQTIGDRRTYTRTLSDGTVNVPDHEDAHTLDATLPSYFFEKTVQNLTTGASPATNASPGDRLRYQLRIENLTALSVGNFTILDELDRLNAPPVFEPGTLTLGTPPPGSDASNTSNTGGSQGTGLVDIRNVTFPAQGVSLVVVYDVTLAGVIANGTLATDQAQLGIGGAPFADSDDPGVNGQASSNVANDEDPTVVVIDSAPFFQVEKISDDITGDPALLLAGETLRYTITVKNVGTDNAVDAELRDAIPVNTTYVPGSTTLNGSPVADVGGLPPFSSGLPIYAPEDPTPGAMRADASATTSNVATIVFDVVVDPSAVDGTIISNQAFVSAVSGGVVDQPSDDPATPTLDDPTRDVVGAVPLLFATKSVVISADAPPLGQVDPGDELRYTITLTNSGAVPATGASLTDSVPANTTYLDDTTTLNGLGVGQPDGGVSPLANGFAISSSDLTPPLPGAGAGVINPGQSAVVEFELVVNAGVPAGTLISNQAVVSTDTVPNLLTDGDGNPATGPEPTVVVVGAVQQLAITKQVTVVGGGAALPGSELEYVVQVTNIGTVPADSVVITDDLDAPVSGQLSYVPNSATLQGSTAGIGVLGSVITADWSSGNGPLAPGEVLVLRFRATLDAGLAVGTSVTNTGVVSWDDPTRTASASVTISVGGMPGVGILNGAVWHDADFDRAIGGTERLLQGWTVSLYRNGTLLQSTTTDAAGLYRLSGLPPNDVTGDSYELRFQAPGAGANTAALGRTVSPFTNGLQSIVGLVVTSGANLQDLNLPIDPNGVVYDSLLRSPIAGVALALLDGPGGSPVPASCFDDPLQQGQVTPLDGWYKFELNFSDPACPPGAAYVIEIAAGSQYQPGYSQIDPPLSGPATAAFSVPTCPGTANDAVLATLQHCEAQPSELAPPLSVPPRTVGTTHHVHLLLDASQPPGSSQIFNNHIPLDPVLNGLLGVTKTTPSLTVSRGELVPYEIGIRNNLGVPILDLGIVDRFPAGFHYVKGSARVDGVAIEPAIDGQELTWPNLGVDADSTKTLVLLFAVGAGVGDGEFVNRAQAMSGLTGLPLSGQATATVRVVPDPDFACTDVTGKVFDDANRNGAQDPNELGLPGVRLVTLRGLVATTDAHGRYHVTCAVAPNDQRGTNFVLKLDERTLPTGFRMSTRRTQIQRATRGKALRLNFAASIHRVVSLDMADAVFEPGTTEMRPQWKPRIDLLLDTLRQAHSTLRLSYMADLEDESLVKRRLKAVKKQIIRAWKQGGGDYRLEIESEIFWRRGAPVPRPTARAGGQP